jgi:Spy/CpxP family protein refolding chaperone
MCSSWALRRHRAFAFHQHCQSETGPSGWGEESMGHGRHRGVGQGPPDEGFGGFGVRRPLRFLAHKLELDEKQVVEMARILDDLKTERAQAAVDDRRTLADFADAFSTEAFDAGKSSAGAQRRIDANQKLQAAITRALGQIHACLNGEQRTRLAYLIRSGVLQI